MYTVENLRRTVGRLVEIVSQPELDEGRQKVLVQTLDQVATLMAELTDLFEDEHWKAELSRITWDELVPLAERAEREFRVGRYSEVEEVE